MGATVVVAVVCAGGYSTRLVVCRRLEIRACVPHSITIKKKYAIGFSWMNGGISNWGRKLGSRWLGWWAEVWELPQRRTESAILIAPLITTILARLSFGEILVNNNRTARTLSLTLPALAGKSNQYAQGLMLLFNIGGGEKEGMGEGRGEGWVPRKKQQDFILLCTEKCASDGARFSAEYVSTSCTKWCVVCVCK